MVEAMVNNKLKQMEAVMVKLYEFNEKHGNWIFVRYGTKEKAEQYAEQGFIVIHLISKTK